MILAFATIALLVLGSVAAILTDGAGGPEDDSADDQPVIQVTPGQEIERLETAVASDPDDVDSLVVLAEVLANSGRITESIPWFERAIERRPEDANLRLAFGRALQRAGNNYDAELQLAKAAELDPEQATAAYYLAQLLESLGETRLDDARAWYRRVVEIDPDSQLATLAQQRLTALGEESASPATGP